MICMVQSVAAFGTKSIGANNLMIFSLIFFLMIHLKTLKKSHGNIISLFFGIVGEEIRKRSIDIKSLYRKAHTLLNIRWDISSGLYDAQTFIEKLKRIDDALHISSLVYPLLELQKQLQTLP